MTTRFAPLSRVGLAVGFGIAALVAAALLFIPMGFSMFGAHGYGMHGNAGYGMVGGGYGMMGGGAGFMTGWALLAWIWIGVVGAVAGAIVAALYNASIGHTAVHAQSPEHRDPMAPAS